MKRQHRSQRTNRGQAGERGLRQSSQWLGLGIAILASVVPWPRGAQDSAQRPFSPTPTNDARRYPASRAWAGMSHPGAHRSLHNVSTVNFRYAATVSMAGA